MNRKSIPNNIAFHVRPPNVQSFLALFRGFRAEPWINVYGNDLFLLSRRGRRERAERIPERAQERLHHDRNRHKTFSVRSFVTPVCTAS